MPAVHNKVPGDPVSLPRDHVSLPEDPVSLPGGAVSLLADHNKLPGDVVSLPGDRVSLPADVVSLPGDPVSLLNIAVSWLAERLSVSTQAEELSAKMMRVVTMAGTANTAREVEFATDDSVPGFGAKVPNNTTEVSARNLGRKVLNAGTFGDCRSGLNRDPAVTLCGDRSTPLWVGKHIGTER